MAATQGFAPAQHTLGVMYATGDALPQSDISAQMWYFLAGAEGYEPAIYERDVLAAKLPSASLAEAKRRAERCKASDYSDCE